MESIVRDRIERVARAIYDSPGPVIGWWKSWDDLTDAVKNEMRQRATKLLVAAETV